MKELTDIQISEACLLWMHGIEDKRIAAAIGVSPKVLRKRLSNTQEARLFVLKIMGKDIKIKTKLRVLKIRFKNMFEASYLQKLHKVTASAEAEDDYKTASSNLKWLMEKLMPDKYGKTTIDHKLPVVEITLPKGINDGEI